MDANSPLFHVFASAYKRSHSLQFRLELCQHNVKHGMRSADQSLACAAVNRPQQNVGSSHGSKVCQRHYPSSPNLNPPVPSSTGLSKRGPAPKLMDHKRGKKEIKSELHQLTPMIRWPIMLKYAMLHWCNMLQYLSLQWYRNSFNIHYYWTHPRAWIQGTRTNCQCQLFSSQKQKTPSKGSKNVNCIAFNVVYIFSVVYAQSFASKL